jgi:ubiquitin-protein ligase
MNRVLKRIVNIDMKKIDDLKELGIHIEFDESNILKAYCIIFGTEDTIYHGGILFFEINFPINYPYAPLNIKYISNGNNVRIHPNIYTCGKICLSILGTWPGPKWTSIMDVSSVLISIKSLLDNNPIYHEPGYSCKNQKNKDISDMYNEIVLYNCIYKLYNNNFKNIPSKFQIFNKIINNHYYNNKNYIDNIIKKNISINKLLDFPLYRIHSYIDYKII